MQDRGSGTAARIDALGVAVALAALAATTAVAAIPPLRFAYREPSLHVALETAAAIVALLAGYLALGRFRRSGSLSDLLLATSLGVLASSNLFFAALPAAVAEGELGTASTWMTSVGSFLGVALFAAAAFAPRRTLSRARSAEQRALAAAVGTLAAVAAAGLAARGHLPAGVEPELTAESASRPRLVGHPALLALQVAGVLLFSAAAIGFGRRAGGGGDDFTRLLGVGAVLGAAARLNYVLYPSRYSEWVYTGDVFRLLFYLVVLYAAAREIRSYWQSAARVAVLEERRRIARDLHDGLVQELVYIRRNVARLEGSDVIAGRIGGSAARALDESRRAIDALTRPLDEPLDAALDRAVTVTAAREGTRVVSELAEDVAVPPGIRDALVRIACEAVANAARHGGAPVVRLSLSNGDRLRLSVADDGRGFDPDGVAPGPRSGFGLVSMRERAAAIGAELVIDSAPGAGTRVEVVL